MKALFGVLSLLIVVAVLGTLAKKQMGGLSTHPASAPGGNAVQQSQQIQQQVKQSLDAAMQQARPASDDK